jgi:hypothetical protein
MSTTLAQRTVEIHLPESPISAEESSQMPWGVPSGGAPTGRPSAQDLLKSAGEGESSEKGPKEASLKAGIGHPWTERKKKYRQVGSVHVEAPRRQPDYMTLQLVFHLAIGKLPPKGRTEPNGHIQWDATGSKRKFWGVGGGCSSDGKGGSELQKGSLPELSLSKLSLPKGQEWAGSVFVVSPPDSERPRRPLRPYEINRWGHRPMVSEPMGLGIRQIREQSPLDQGLRPGDTLRAETGFFKVKEVRRGCEGCTTVGPGEDSRPRHVHLRCETVFGEDGPKYLNGYDERTLRKVGGVWGRLVIEDPPENVQGELPL